MFVCAHRLATARPAFLALPTRRLFFYSNRASSTQSKLESESKSEAHNNQKTKSDKNKHQQEHNQPEKNTHPMLKRDAELLAKLLDRDGGEAGVAIIDGTYEEGLGRETKKNMFRLI